VHDESEANMGASTWAAKATCKADCKASTTKEVKIPILTNSKPIASGEELTVHKPKQEQKKKSLLKRKAVGDA